MQQAAVQSRELLTARQVQQLLQIDRSTVYRMAGDGRLSAIRVGKQLRFPAAQLTGLSDAPQSGLDAGRAEAAVEVAAVLLGVTMVVTDMTGRPVTAIANPCPWFVAHREDDQLAECLDEWRTLAEDPDLAPRFVASPAGFECARAFIRSGSSLIGMVLAGGLAPLDDQSRQDLHELDEIQRQRVLRALPVIAATLGRAARSEPEEMKESV